MVKTGMPYRTKIKMIGVGESEPRGNSSQGGQDGGRGEKWERGEQRERGKEVREVT